MHNPFVPEPLEGWKLPNLMYRIKWSAVRTMPPAELDRLAAQFVCALAVKEGGPTAYAQMLGHKADLMVICFRRGFEALAEAQQAISRAELSDYLEATTSYV